jgi:ABC-type bacteriocin/lantibiotic exporter with double-glycine peptidase domain
MSSLDDPDWSAGAWESDYRTRLVRQRERTDCGVACLAMAAGIDYAAALATFVDLGYADKKPRLATNYTELTAALRLHGLAVRMTRWRGWTQFSGLGILKTRAPNRPNRGRWHWVVAESHPSHGYLVRDPNSPLAALERPPLSVCCRDLERAAVISGCWLQVT